MAMGETFDPVPILADLALKCRTAAIVYQKPGEAAPTERIVEPYRLEASRHALMVLCWQVSPNPADGDPWRNFRTDRILSVLDGGSTFEPRAVVTIGTGEVHSFVPPAAEAAARDIAEYSALLEKLLLSATGTDDDMENAENIASAIDEGALKVIHARLFAQLLEEIVLDGRVTRMEEKHIARARKMLKRFGWAP
jgi:hypothetical protein